MQEIDPYGNITRYTYDPVTNKIIQTELPPILGLDGQSIPVTQRSTYDALGRELTKTDENSQTTSYRYNALGSPTEITHPDGSQEHFRYAITGQLKSYTDRDGLTTEYTRDLFDRVTSKTYYTTNEESIARETYVYNAFNLLEETDREGHHKTYSYDGAGRLISESYCGKLTSYAYDNLGRQASIVQHNGENTLCTVFKRDLLDRVLERTQTTPAGNVLHKIAYRYDSKGNINRTTRLINGSEAIEESHYDSLNRLIEKCDALGNATKISYEETALNAIGQKVLSKRIIDPKQITTLVIHDAYDREVKREILDANQGVLSCQEMTYDGAGNLLQKQDHIHVDGTFQKTQTVRYQYTSTNEVESCTRAYGTPLARTTTYDYTPEGQIAVKRMPNGIHLYYDYHPFGFLAELTSSDGKVHLKYSYNKLGHLLQACDLTTGVSIQREVDPFGNILSERFSHGLKIDKTYDCRDRPLEVSLSGQGTIQYQYDPLYLRSVIRQKHPDDRTYVHQYSEYDLAGHVVTEQLMDDLGSIHHTVDLKGRKIGCKSSYFTQQCVYDERDNLVQAWVDDRPFTYDYDDLSQLRLEEEADGSHTYLHDSNYNRVIANDHSCETNDLNELLSSGPVQCTYDLNGNLISKKTPQATVNFTYNALNQLLEVSDDRLIAKMTYDPLGRRLSKTAFLAQEGEWTQISHENYLYDGENEIGAFDVDGRVKQLRVLGLALHKNAPQTVAIELSGELYVPLMDFQGNIGRLVDSKSKKITESYDFSAFGEEFFSSVRILANPWRYASKRTDPEFNLINFGKRYYDPELGRWLATDPAGFIDGTNLYVYLFNNPFRYIDPDGQFAAVLLLPLLEWGGAAGLTWLVSSTAICTAITGALVYTAISWGMDTIIAKDGPDDSDPYETEVEYQNRGKGKQWREKKRRPKDEDGHDPIPDRSDEQNKQARAARRAAEKNTGKRFNHEKERIHHKNTTGRGLNFRQLMEAAEDVLNGLLR